MLTWRYQMCYQICAWYLKRNVHWVTQFGWPSQLPLSPPSIRSDLQINQLQYSWYNMSSLVSRMISQRCLSLLRSFWIRFLWRRHWSITCRVDDAPTELMALPASNIEWVNLNCSESLKTSVFFSRIVKLLREKYIGGWTIRKWGQSTKSCFLHISQFYHQSPLSQLSPRNFLLISLHFHLRWNNPYSLCFQQSWSPNSLCPKY